ncbi:MAG: rhodanese-like domain-containing protein [Nitrospirae bacterium]|nr:MAG: rhodanese-like domain-containing protein [Nitrospirota bacterium]
MDKLGLGLAAVSSVVATMSLWRTLKLGSEVQRLKQHDYETESKVREVTRRLTEAVEQLRILVAAVASGETLDADLIRSGRLYRELSVEEVRSLLSAPSRQEIVLVDVRTLKEFSHAHLPGALLLPVEELEQRYRAEIPRQGKQVVMYCSTGDRSRLACEFLSRQGYVNLSVMKGGLQQWRGPLEQEGPASLVQIESRKASRR